MALVIELVSYCIDRTVRHEYCLWNISDFLLTFFYFMWWIVKWFKAKYLNFISYLNIKSATVFEIVHHGRRRPVYTRTHSYGCCCSGDQSQWRLCIGTHDLDIVILEYRGSSMNGRHTPTHWRQSAYDPDKKSGTISFNKVRLIRVIDWA